MLFKNINSNRILFSLGEVCSGGNGGIQTGPFGSQLHKKDYVTEGTPIITVEHLLDNRISHENTPKVSREDKQRLSKYVLQKGDIVFSRVGSVDRRSIVRESEDGWLFSGRCLRVRANQAKVDPLYLSYYLGHSVVKTHLRSIAVGATMPSLNTKLLAGVEVLLPLNLQEQRQISNILGTLDDKIELNRKTNETLEGIAKGLFKSWFVDFDPVRAKAEGRPTGLPDEISELFPDSFEESELGEIPSGWECRPLSDFFSIQGGSQPPAKTFIDDPREGYVRLLQIRDFLGDSHLTFVPEAKNLRLVSEDDVLIGRYGSGSGKFMDDSLGRPLRGLSGAINVAVVRTIPKQSNMVELIYAMVLSGWFYRQIVGGSARAVQAGFRKEDLDLIPFALPPDQVLDVFQELGGNIWEKSKLLTAEINTLSLLRDALLPRLISGELRVPDAEKMLEEVGV